MVVWAKVRTLVGRGFVGLTLVLTGTIVLFLHLFGVFLVFHLVFHLCFHLGSHFVFPFCPTVIGFNPHTSHPIVMFSPKIGLSTMAKKQRQISPLTWEKKSGSDVVATRTALPLRLSYALTIHKSQGQTLPRVEISFTNGSFANGQAYSALSRATGFRGLTIKKLKESDIKVAKKVIDWYMMVFGTVS